jgi:hypothetical protein
MKLIFKNSINDVDYLNIALTIKIGTNTYINIITLLFSNVEL